MPVTDATGGLDEIEATSIQVLAYFAGDPAFSPSGLTEIYIFGT